MKDNFSKQASTYARFRPHYPPELYGHLLTQMNNTGTVWDCGTGNGQVAVQLAQHFGKVYATDISQAQLDHAPKEENIEYICSSAEDSGLPEKSIDLITVAQAMHWFDQEKFYQEIKRVARPNALVAYWAYFLPVIEPKIDETVLYIHDHIVGPHWDLEREIWRNRYESISLPLQQKEKKAFEYKAEWTYEQLEGYLNSWSAVQHCIDKTGKNPIPEYLSPLKKNWQQPKDVVFPILLFAGRV